MKYRKWKHEAATSVRRRFVCRTIHAYGEVDTKRRILELLAVILKISPSTVRTIHKEHCFLNEIK